MMKQITEEQKKAELEKLVSAHNDLLEFVQTERGQKRFQQYLEGLAGLDEFGKFSLKLAREGNMRGSIKVIVDMKLLLDIMAAPYAETLIAQGEAASNCLKIFRYAEKRIDQYIDAVEGLAEGGAVVA